MSERVGPSEAGTGAVESSGPRRSGRTRNVEVYFDPAKSVTELVDNLAQRQARSIRRISAPELAKFYGEIKELERILLGSAGNAGDVWHRQVEPRVRLLRSKVYYANRRVGQGHSVPREFREFIDRSVQSIRNEEDFLKFVKHFEAVVGFLYGMGSVQS